MKKEINIDKIAIIGLGYVGLPLSIAFSKKISVLGIDINQERVNQLKKGNDQNEDISKIDLENSNLEFTNDFSKLKDYKYIIVTVPTPVDKNKKPDLTAIKSASKEIGDNLSKDSIIIYESTVYPGVTEEICVKEIEKSSNLKHKKDFFVGYSPERINPSDKKHTVENITKIVSADNPEVLETVAKIYKIIVKADIYKAESIKTAEMAKVIENTQRDINIALMNEISIICNKLDLKTHEVLAAAKTKWNFLPFTPGLVGGHCIGVDPYYLTYKCEEINHHPNIILAGRRINDSMGKYIAENTVKMLIKSNKNVNNAKILILGVTFKENIKDIRNSKIKDIVDELREYQVEVILNDPYADSDNVKNYFGSEIVTLKDIKNLDGVILAVAHDEYNDISLKKLKEKCNEKAILIDVKNLINQQEAENNKFIYWSL